jgi:MOSC domain-containing protein YiiM
MSARVVSVNVGRPAPFATGRRVVQSAIVKAPVAAFGENLTLEGVDVSGARIGERWRIGTAELQITGPRVPCFKLEARIGVRGFQRAFLEAGRPGAYLAIVGEGELEAGDAVEIVHRPAHDVSVALALEVLLLDRSRVGELAAARADMLPKLAGWYEELRAA